MSKTRDYSETRQSNGRFGTHNPGGPGRPKREVEQMYLDTAVETVTLEDWATIVKSMVSRAKAGDVAAAKWVSENITIGKPVDRLNVTNDKPEETVVLWNGGSGDDES